MQMIPRISNKTDFPGSAPYPLRGIIAYRGILCDLYTEWPQDAIKYPLSARKLPLRGNYGLGPQALKQPFLYARSEM